MNTFDDWLRVRLAATGCIGGEIEDNDLHAAIERFQCARGLPVTGIADDDTVAELRKQKSTNPESNLTVFHAVPSNTGSAFAATVSA